MFGIFYLWNILSSFMLNAFLNKAFDGMSNANILSLSLSPWLYQHFGGEYDSHY